MAGHGWQGMGGSGEVESVGEARGGGDSCCGALNRAVRREWKGRCEARRARASDKVLVTKVKGGCRVGPFRGVGRATDDGSHHDEARFLFGEFVGVESPVERWRRRGRGRGRWPWRVTRWVGRRTWGRRRRRRRGGGRRWRGGRGRPWWRRWRRRRRRRVRRWGGRRIGRPRRRWRRWRGGRRRRRRPGRVRRWRRRGGRRRMSGR